MILKGEYIFDIIIMMSIKRYDHKASEKKWQKTWTEKGIYKASDFGERKKYYALVEFPYPSGAGLHVGHVRSWAAMDAYSRRKRMQGFNVLFPMGWDSFGLPAENYAIKTGIHPSITVKENINNFRRQCNSLGLSFDWSKEIDTTDSKYYKWTQWIFVQMFKKGLAYRKEVPVNWCGFCKTNLADEEVMSDGRHERCGNPTVKRNQNQWLLRITKYADRLLADLNEVDFSPRIRVQQENWIGRKEWVDIKYKVENTNEEIVVSTTRPDTNFGATFIVMSPEHPFVDKILSGEVPTESSVKNNISKYVKLSKSKSDTERIAEGKEKTGVFTKMYAINGLNGYKMPIYITDFVLMSVGTGVVVGVPGHDIRDFQFAEKFGIPVIRVIAGADGNKSDIKKSDDVYEGEGTLVNSGFLNGMNVPQATEKVTEYLENKGLGGRTIRYHIHDWVFSRQHYWGEPIPMVYCGTCAKASKSWFTENHFEDLITDDWSSKGWYPVSEEDLPVELPYMEKYQPSGTGDSPLANNPDFIKTKCPNCGSEAKRETDTMPNWAGSNWYYLGYLISNSLVDQKLSAKGEKFQNIFEKNEKEIKYWMPVDMYQGGYEHTTLHLLYSRFVYKFLFDLGVVPNKEPYMKRRSHGIVLGADGRKMSKSFGNVINPDVIVEKFGADTLRLYEMFMGPFDQAVMWSDESVEGCFRFLGRVWRLFNEKVASDPTDKNLSMKFHQTIKKIDEDIEDMKFNTAVSSLMEFSNFWNASGDLNTKDAKVFCRLIAPFVPHFAEDVWQVLTGKNNTESVHTQSWPSFDQNLTVEDTITIPIQVNGKLRGTITVGKGKENDKEYISNTAKDDKKISKWIIGNNIKKEIYIPGKLLNFVY